MKDFNEIKFLNNPSPVSMADEWFIHGTSEHFWVRHRNELIRKFFGNLIRESNQVGEIGCGSGLVLSYLSETLHKSIDGFELNLNALRLCPKINGSLYIYDILRRQPDFLEKYDVLMMMDVLEHIEDEQEFLNAVRDHITPKGYLIVGVPMRQNLYSAYDRADGHYRRYSQNYLKSIVELSGFKLIRSVQWGHSYLPLLIIRKMILGNKVTGDAAVKKGFAISPFMNKILSTLKILDILPTFNITGASSMILIQKI
jgi:SAM-dependent methyltransferase